MLEKKSITLRLSPLIVVHSSVKGTERRWEEKSDGGGKKLQNGR